MEQQSTAEKVKEPLSDLERRKMLAHISQAFSPSAPVNTSDLFAGRIEQIDNVISSVFQRGQHVIIFGERGVGKTSLATVLSDFLGSIGLQSLDSGTINCDQSMDFSSLWHKISRDLTINFETRKAGFTAKSKQQKLPLNLSLPVVVSPDDVRQMLSQLSEKSIIIMDEVDRLRKDDNTTILLADTIKTLSDHSIDTTLILVGVADSVGELITEHKSVERALRQIHMPRMSKPEIYEILEKATKKANMIISEGAKELVSRLSKGLPHYAHSLGLNASKFALTNKRSNVTKDDVKNAIKETLAHTQQSINDAYHKAVTSSRGNLYQQVLLACALAPTDFLGYFSAADAREPLSKIMGKRYDIPAFAPHLHTFCSEERGGILQKTGTPRRFKFRFQNPLIQPFVIMRGIEQELIDESFLDKL